MLADWIGSRLIMSPRTLFDAAAVMARVEAARETAADDPAFRADAARILREALEAGRARVADALEEAPASGPAASRSIAWVTDETVRATIEIAQRWLAPNPSPTEGEKIAVLAVGGYGRFEMAPFSDVDLLFLTPWKSTGWVEKLVENVLYLLWDLRLKVGHSVRTIDDCIRLAREDITIRTALLENRFISGQKALAKELDQRLWSELFEKTGPEFVEAKLDERAQRHARHGGSRYLLEPNVKEGKGGLRDLQTLFWIAKYLYHATGPEDLVEKGFFTEDEMHIFGEAEAFLWTVRCHLHINSGRANEQLTFDQQVEVAKRLGFEDEGGQRGVERFMQTYFSHARNVGELTRIFLAALEAQHVKKRPTISGILRFFSAQNSRGDDPFPMRDGRLDIRSEEVLTGDPINILRIFSHALKTGALIHPNALRMLAAHLNLVDDDLRANPEANRIFLDLMLNSGDPERALRRMTETGVMGRFLPEFGRVVAMMQFNMYHHYTVDEHTIMAIRTLHRIEKGELKTDLPLSSMIMNEGVDRTVLYVALLLHDIGKGLPEDHSEVGARVAEEVCPRLGLKPEETETVAWLVRHHLLMSDVAQKRDISDPITVKAFADVVRSPTRLRLLLVLTACDIIAVGPGVWNNWKAQLLRQLYSDAREQLTGGAESRSRKERVAEAQAALREKLSDWDAEELEAEIARHYPAYWLGLDTDAHAQLAILGRDRAEDRVESDITQDTAADVSRACFVMADHPGIFSRMAGALALAGANVVDARTFTTKDGYTSSAFWIQSSEGKPYDRTQLDRLRRTIKRTLNGEVVARDALKPKRKVKKRESKFTVPTRVTFDNSSSDIYTVIEVDTRDRPGLLYDLARGLAACNTAIASAIIATYGEQAVDVFYVRDLFGLKIRNASKMEQIEEAIREAVERAGQSDG
ncbi:[protein-PII] uridylyltransferase [Rhodovulum sp. DZ06]|uniref:[protein-PII] uridylyltransferase n=1 Tax=Rhodovulum sp. DZ06 TaxID=3425126 RepID=UPI003D350F56